MAGFDLIAAALDGLARIGKMAVSEAEDVRSWPVAVVW